MATAWLLALALLGPGEVVAGALEPDLSTGASALDAWAALRDAEERTWRVRGPGIHSFACRVRSPQLARLADGLSSVPGGELTFALWWQAPDRRDVTLSGARGELSPEAASSLTSLVEPLHDLLLADRPTERLRGHVFVFVEEPSADTARRVIEARAASPDDPRRRARYMLDAEGLIVGERTETAEGERSEYVYVHERRAGRHLLVGATGIHRGVRVDLTIDWGLELDGRPLPTRVTVRRLDALGRPVEPLGEIEYRLSGHRLNEELPGWLFQSGPAAGR
jgi:hypothetical protein